MRRVSLLEIAKKLARFPTVIGSRDLWIFPRITKCSAIYTFLDNIILSQVECLFARINNINSCAAKSNINWQC
ncbi:hypothetical protein DPMN_004472 [Dreissena polymorpha]|uniref:Uncharacterized protein n=1 Tax=Dreissena polymorpha TaxID=45954 RepID=A0A9D4MQV5_DREPO|nr:hypothetical protein DPMN_004472 [Dreissena polymorpha]